MLYFLLAIIILLVIVLFLFYRIYKKCKEELLETKRVLRRNETKLCMLEYYYRNFKEGENPHTTLRNISNLLKDVIM